MSIKINIHTVHCRHTGGEKMVEAKGSTVGEALRHLADQYPGMRGEIFDKTGKLLHYIEIYLNGKSAYPGELEKKVRDGDEIQITKFLAGG